MAVTATSNPDIRSLSLDELTDWFTAEGEKSFRAKQVYEWLWQKAATDFDSMTNLSKPLREKLKDRFSLPTMQIAVEQKSNDGTVKYALKLHDEEVIEGVLIPTETRMTACVSSQVGCSLACKFCATGFLARKRNLLPHEIYDQVVLLNKAAIKHFNRPLSNIVFMGMGEPLLNYKNVLAGIDRLTAPDGLDMSPKRITVSTAGIAKMIQKLGDDQVKFNLALSLHAANDSKRSELMAINDTNNLKVLIKALNDFFDKTRNQITYEYILFDGFNDGDSDAKELISLCRKVPAKVNVIEYNPVDKVDLKKTGEQQRERFINSLEKAGVTAKVRRSRGKDIDAACGQLANLHQ